MDLQDKKSERLRSSLSDAGDTGYSQRLRWWDWWPVLLGPLAMAFTYVAKAAGWRFICSKGMHETAALVLLAIAIVVFGIRATMLRSELHLLLTVLCVVFFCRELHFEGTSTGVYIAVAAIGAWAFVWRNRLKEAFTRGKIMPWLIATGWTYLLSQLIARRLFKRLCLPYENEYHVILEETVESAAHIMLMICGFVAWKAGTKKSE